MAKKPESKLQARIRARLEKDVGGFWRKVWGGPYQACFLDLVGCVNGLYFEIEVKMPKKRHNTSDVQDLTIEMVQLAKGVSGVVTSPEEAVELVRAALARAKGSSRPHPETKVRSPVRAAKNRKDVHIDGRARKALMAERPDSRPPNRGRQRVGRRP